MKKILVIALAVVMTLSIVAFAACATEQTVTGECSYTVSDWHTTYGAKVDVTVKGNVITAVKLYTDEETGWVRTTASWTAAEGQLGFDAAEAAYEQWLTDTFVGKTVDQVKAVKTTMISGDVTVDQSYTVTVDASNKADWALAGATQSSARIIVAVQNALSKLAK